MSLLDRFLFFVFIAYVIALVLGVVTQAAAIRFAGMEATFMLVAAANVLGAMIRRDGTRDAVVSFVILGLGSGLVACIGAATGRPFGPYSYTDRLLPHLLGVPIAVPLFWYTVIASGHYLVFHWGRFRSRRLTAFAVALWALLFAVVIEPIAVFFDYWMWNTPGVPAQNYVAWFVVAFLLARLAPLGRGPIDRFDLRPASVGGFLLILFVIVRIVARS